MSRFCVESPVGIRSPHYAIIVFSNRYIHHKGDERSRTNPGHGYPAYTENITDIKYYVYELGEKAEWLLHLEDLYKQEPKRTDVVAMEVNKIASIGTNINVNI